MNEKFCVLIKISLKFFSYYKGPIDEKPSVGLDDDFVPNGWQVIIWNNADPIHWHIYASLGGDELRAGPSIQAILECISEVRVNLPIYRKVSNIRRTQIQNLNNSRLNMQLPLPNPLKPGVKSRMKM